MEALGRIRWQDVALSVGQSILSQKILLVSSVCSRGSVSCPSVTTGWLTPRKLTLSPLHAEQA